MWWYLERKYVLAKLISHPFLKSSLLPLHRWPYKQEKVSWRGQPQTNVIDSLLFSFYNSVGSAHAAFLQSSPRPTKLLRWSSCPSTLPPSALSLWIQDPQEPDAWAPSPVSRVACSLCHKPAKGKLGWKAQVASGKIKKGLWAQAVETTPTVQIFILEQLCWELLLEDRTAVLLQDPCPVINLVSISGYPAY